MTFGQIKHPVLDVPLTDVFRPEIALSLQHLMKIYTVGSFLRAWGEPGGAVEHSAPVRDRRARAPSGDAVRHVGRLGLRGPAGGPCGGVDAGGLIESSVGRLPCKFTSTTTS